MKVKAIKNVIKLSLLQLLNLYSEYVSPRFILERRYQQIYGSKPNLKEPVTHSEHILARCINYSREMIDLSDKVLVRKYVSNKIGEKFLVPLFFSGRKLLQQDYDGLPDQFVIKANNSSGCNLIVRDKSNYTFSELEKITAQWLLAKFYLQSFELHYKKIKPLILAEKLLLDENGNVPNDYKIQYFRNGGFPKLYIQVESNRFSDHRTDLFDEDWNILNVRVGNPRSKNPGDIRKPENLKEMLELAKVLAEPFECVRVDFYEVDSQIFFGELTFTPGAGMVEISPIEIELEWGLMWK